MKKSQNISKKIPVQILATFLIFGQLPSQFAHAVSTDIADIPMAVANAAAPNIMFTLDDSGSMQFEVIPEDTYAYFSFPRPDPLYGNNWGYGSNYSYVPKFVLADRYARYFRTAKFNLNYYNPIKYGFVRMIGFELFPFSFVGVSNNASVNINHSVTTWCGDSFS